MLLSAVREKEGVGCSIAASTVENISCLQVLPFCSFLLLFSIELSFLDTCVPNFFPLIGLDGA